MAAPNVSVREVDLSTRVPAFPGVYGGIVIGAKKGPVDQPVLTTNDSQLLRYFTPDEDIKPDYDGAYMSALTFLSHSDKLWVMRAAQATAEMAGIHVKKAASSEDHKAFTGSEDLIASADPAGALDDDDAYIIYSKDPGAWGNDISIRQWVYHAEERQGVTPLTVTAVNTSGPVAQTPVTEDTEALDLEYEVTLPNTPVKPGTVTVTGPNGTEAADDGSGNLVGEGISGTVDYETGVVDLEFDADPGNSTGGISVAYSKEILEYSGTLPYIPLDTKDFTVQIPGGTVMNDNDHNGSFADGGNSGTINYSTGAWTLTLASDPGATVGGIVFSYYRQAVQAVSITGGKTLEIPTSQRWYDGEPVYVALVNPSESDSYPTTVSFGITYYTIDVTPPASTAYKVRLAASLEDALAKRPINIGSSGSAGAGTLEIVPVKRVKEPDTFLVEVLKGGTADDDGFVTGASIVETWTCSRDPEKKDGYNERIWLPLVLQRSQYVRAEDAGLVNGYADEEAPKPIVRPMALTCGTDGDGVLSAEDYAAAARTAYSLQGDRLLTVLMDGGYADAVYQQALIDIVENRNDSVAVLSTPYEREASSDYLNEIVQYKRNVLISNSSHAALYTPHVFVADRFNKRNVYVSPDGYAASAISNNAYNYELWYPPAGWRRSSINALDLRRHFTPGEMDWLYDNNVNPLRFHSTKGICIWGQKTLQTRPSQLDRLNVRLLLCVLTPAIKDALEDFIFELNDESTRERVVLLLTTYMEGIQARRGVTGFSVVCDDSNNSPEDVENHVMNVWLFIKPAESIEYIPFTLVLTRQSMSFSVAQRALIV